MMASTPPEGLGIWPSRCARTMSSVTPCITETPPIASAPAARRAAAESSRTLGRRTRPTADPESAHSISTPSSDGSMAYVPQSMPATARAAERQLMSESSSWLRPVGSTHVPMVLLVCVRAARAAKVFLSGRVVAPG